MDTPTLSAADRRLKEQKEKAFQDAFIKKVEEFAIKAHHNTNHFYDEYLPYEFHLRMVVKVANDFLRFIPKESHHIVIAACFCHDATEDVRENYNSIKKNSCVEVAEIARAVTNYGRGRTRAERMPDFVYEDIRNTPFATFVKLCDRIANVQYSKLTGSRMFGTYKEEHPHFKEKLFKSGEYEDMWNYIDDLFDKVS